MMGQPSGCPFARRVGRTLAWARKNLRTPRINCLETWYHKSRNDLNLMRATAAMSLTHSDGYCLFSDPDPLPTGDHLHNWYPFWNRSLGRPRSAGKKRSDGSYVRQFDKGTVVYNPMGNADVTIVFDRDHKSLAGGRTAKRHTVKACDGDILLGPRHPVPYRRPDWCGASRSPPAVTQRPMRWFPRIPCRHR